MSGLPVIFWQRGQPGMLGTCGITIADYGCWLCSNAMNLQKMAHAEVEPIGLNGLWLGSPGWAQGCMGWAGLTPASYSDVTLIRQGYGLGAAQGVNPDSECATIGVDATATLGSPTHYLAYDHTELDGRVICGDPWVGDLCDVIARYGNVTTVDVYTSPNLTPKPKSAPAAVLLAVDG